MWLDRAWRAQVRAGDVLVSKVWPTATLSRHLIPGEGEPSHYTLYQPSLEERLALTAYLEARKGELEARATRLWLRDTQQESYWRSLLLLLKPLGFESVDQALESSLSALRDDPDLGLPDERLEKYMRIVASKDLFKRTNKAGRAAWVAASARISTPKPGDELLGIVTADGVRHDVRSTHAREMARPLSKSRKKLKPDVLEAFALLDEDKSKMLDTEELNEGFAALGISKTDKQVRKVLTSVQSSNRQYSVYEARHHRPNRGPRRELPQRRTLAARAPTPLVRGGARVRSSSTGS